MSEPAGETAADQESRNPNLPGYRGFTAGIFDVKHVEGDLGVMGSQLNSDGCIPRTSPQRRATS